MSYGVGHRHGSDPVWLWLWRGPVATALIGPLVWEPPYAAGAALEKAKRHTHKKIFFNKIKRHMVFMDWQIEHNKDVSSF